MDERTTLRYIDELQGQIDQLRRIIKGGGGGSSVVINPEGSATADLEKIKSGDIIYGLNYNKNANRPQINGNLLTGNKNSKQLNIAEEMTESDYDALSSKNENEIYFLTENAMTFTETDTVAASGITWVAGEDPDTYTATLAYSVVDTDTTGVVSVTCDSDLITIGDPTFSSGTVSVPMVCADPTEITGNIEFTFTLEQPGGFTKIAHGGLMFGEYNYSLKPQKVGKWVDGSDLYRCVVATKTRISVSSSAWATGSWENLPSNISKLIRLELCDDAFPLGHYQYRFLLQNGNIDVAANTSAYFPAGADEVDYLIIYYTITS